MKNTSLSRLDPQQAFEFSGYEPFKYSKEELLKLYLKLARLSILKLKLEKGSASHLNYTEASILSALSAVEDSCLICSAIPNYLAEISRDVSSFDIISGIKSFYLNNADILHYQNLLSENKIFSQYLFGNNSYDSLSVLEDSLDYKENQKVIIASMSSSNIFQLKSVISSAKENESNMSLFLVNELGATLNKESVVSLFGEDLVSESSIGILDSPNILESYEIVSSTEKKNTNIKLYIFNQFIYDNCSEASSSNEVLVDAFKLYEKSLLVRGILSSSDINEIKQNLEDEAKLIGESNTDGIDSQSVDSEQVENLYVALGNTLLKKHSILATKNLGHVVSALENLPYTPNITIKATLDDNDLNIESKVINYSKKVTGKIIFENYNNTTSIKNNSEVNNNISFIFSYPFDENKKSLYAISNSVDAVYSGEDITVLCWGRGLEDIDSYIKQSKDISIEVLNINLLEPLDKDLIYESIKKTGRLLIYSGGGFSTYYAMLLLANLTTEFFEYLDAPIMHESISIENGIENMLSY